MKQKTQNEPATKQDIKSLDKKIDVLDKKIDTVRDVLDKKIDTVKNELQESAEKNKNEIMETLVSMVGELETIREEQVLSVGQYRNHEERIVKLEKFQEAHQ